MAGKVTVCVLGAAFQCHISSWKDTDAPGDNPLGGSYAQPMEQLPALPLEEHFQERAKHPWARSWGRQLDPVEAQLHLPTAAQLLLSSEGIWPCPPSRAFPMFSVHTYYSKHNLGEGLCKPPAQNLGTLYISATILNFTCIFGNTPRFPGSRCTIHKPGS